MISFVEYMKRSFRKKLRSVGVPLDPAQRTPDEQATAGWAWWAVVSEVLLDAGTMAQAAVDTFDPKKSEDAAEAAQVVRVLTAAPAAQQAQQTQPLTITIAPAARKDGAVFTSQTVAYTGQYTSSVLQITGLGSGPGSDYENPANSITFGVYYEAPPGSGNFILSGGGTWGGGAKTFHGVVDPTPTFSGGIAPIGTTIEGQVSITGNLTAGLTCTLTP